MSIISSQQVNWRSVHRYVAPLLESVGTWPTIGTVQWRDLPSEDPAKWAAILDAAQHHALRLELNQQDLIDASKAASAAVDWKTAAQHIRDRREALADGVYVPRRAAS
jgi:hypothetical protein